MKSRAERHFNKIMQPLPAGLGLFQHQAGPNLLVPGKESMLKPILDDEKRYKKQVNRIDLDVKRKGIDVEGMDIDNHRSRFDIDPIQYNVKRIQNVYYR